MDFKIYYRNISAYTYIFDMLLSSYATFSLRQNDINRKSIYIPLECYCIMKNNLDYLVNERNDMITYI